MQQKYRTSVARARLRCPLSAEELGRFGTDLLQGRFNGTSDAVPTVRLKNLPAMEVWLLLSRLQKELRAAQDDVGLVSVSGEGTCSRNRCKIDWHFLFVVAN